MLNQLSDSLVNEVLAYLGCDFKTPTLLNLNRLITAYIRAVPWESVSRIIKRYETARTKDCPRLPEEFWNDAIRYGLGGTCYESSLAFYSLLTYLGYLGYLTVNDMGTSRGCHAAIVVMINRQKYLVDITIPVDAAIRINPDKIVKRSTPFHNFSVQPLGENKYEVMRSHHPQRNAFTLIDIPVSLPHYQMILENDYREKGLFLKSVVIVKVVGDKRYRFFSDRQPFKLESFSRVGKMEELLDIQTLPKVLAFVFQMPADKIADALNWIQNPPVHTYTRDNIVPLFQAVHVLE